MTKITIIRTALAPVVLVALTAAGNAHAQTTMTATTSTQSNLGLGESSGPPKGYAFLLPPAPTRSHVLVRLKPENDLIPADQWTWNVATTDNELKSALTQKWYAQAACPDNLTNLQVIGPGGTLTQNPLWNPIWGYFKTQSFTTSTVKDVCVDWANAHACDPSVPGEQCPVYAEFDLVGGVLPAGPADRLRLKASCGGSPIVDTYYAPTVRVRCDRGAY